MTEATRGFYWHQNFVPWGLSAPDVRLYTFIKSWKDVHKFRGWSDFILKMQQVAKVMKPSVDIKIFALMGCLSLPKGYVQELFFETGNR